MDIYVATDLSPSGQHAVGRALEWARMFGATAVLLHVVHDPLLAPALSNDVAGDLARARVQLQQVADRTAVSCRVDVRAAEDVAGEIVKAAKDAAYLFVSSQGKSAFARLRLGSIATAVLRRSEVPVVCCPHVAADS